MERELVEWVVVEKNVVVKRREVIGVYEAWPPYEVEEGHARRRIYVALSGGQTIELETDDLKGVLSRLGVHAIRDQSAVPHRTMLRQEE